MLAAACGLSGIIVIKMAQGIVRERRDAAYAFVEDYHENFRDDDESPDDQQLKLAIREEE